MVALDLVDAAAGDELATFDDGDFVAQLFRHLGVRLGVEQVGGVLELLCLLADRLHPGGVTVAQAGDADAAGEIGVDLALQAVQSRALAVV